MLDKTFASTMTPAEKLRLLRWIAAATAVVVAATSLLLLWWRSPVWQTWLFDLSIATVLAAAVHLLGRRIAVAEEHRRKRVGAAIVVGVSCAGAALGAYALTLTGRPAGLQQLPALLVVQVLGLMIGAAIGFGAALFTTAVVRGVSRFFACSKPTLDGAVIGALSGALGGVPFIEFPNLGWWFVAASAAWCSFCGFQAADRFAESCTASQSTT